MRLVHKSLSENNMPEGPDSKQSVNLSKCPNQIKWKWNWADSETVRTQRDDAIKELQITSTWKIWRQRFLLSPFLSLVLLVLFHLSPASQPLRLRCKPQDGNLFSVLNNLSSSSCVSGSVFVLQSCLIQTMFTIPTPEQFCLIRVGTVIRKIKCFILIRNVQNWKYFWKLDLFYLKVLKRKSPENFSSLYSELYGW